MRLAYLGSVHLLLIGPLAFGGRAAAQGPGSVARRAAADSCLAPSECQLGRVELHSDAVAAVSALAPPIRKTTRAGEDDGGRYEIQSYYSRGLSIDIVRGMIDRLTTRSPTTSTPSGLRPGLTFNAVQDVLAAKGVTLKQFADTVDIGVCSTTEEIILEDYLTLIFDRQRRLQALALSVERP